MWHVGEEWCMKGFGGETDHLEDPVIDGRIILRSIVRKWGINWIWHRIGTGSRLL
jgi:hypothetical protein